MFTFWREGIRRRVHAKRVSTARDRYLLSKERAQRRQEYRDALRKAHDKIYDLARELKDHFGKHSLEHYHNELIHRAHKLRSTRRVNRWNAFQKLELKRIKEANPGGIKLTDVSREISDRWKSLSQDDRIAITDGCMQEIEDQCEAKDLATQNIPLRAFRDARSTMLAIEKDLCQLNSRTGLEFMLTACRSSTKDFMKPFVVYSSDVVKAFVTDSLNRLLDDLVVQMEAYVMSGLKGVVVNSKTKVLELKRRTAALILGKLQALAGTGISRMEYDRFDELITANHNIVVRNWPIKTFCNPSNVASQIELELLYNGWNSGTAYFEKLMPEDAKAWVRKRRELANPLVESAPALSLLQTPAPEMTLVSKIPQHNLLAIALGHFPTPAQHVPLAPVTNLPSGPIATSPSRPPAPNPNTIQMMIQADPSLQNVDPALIAMSIAGNNSHQARASASSTESPPDRSLASGSKRCWQEIVTPHSYDVQTAKKPRKQQKPKQPKNLAGLNM
ncbi:hypothetical protein BJ322DRAFT_1000888 [Thelephora terrestris]|uniref:HMG box domain-containing protein n=1 Tax=Thelephora terrestris TaxID=56493 RepID=A0A9P6LAF8_9AGAM|nr:hypothetical protein BJ322DRAFT_1000888 [Thelephora terrestris]